MIALSLMAFIFMLIISLGTFTQVETQLGNTQASRSDARDNALLGLQIAVAELQRYAGADQRATAPATTVYPHKDFNELYDGDSNYLSSRFPANDQMWGIYRSFAGEANRRSYLTNATTYLVPSEREAWDDALADWWNGSTSASRKNPHWVAVFDSSLRVDRFTNPSAAPVAGISPSNNSLVQSFEAMAGTTSQPLYGEFKRDQLGAWLVSGNERFTIDPTDPAQTTYPAGYYVPYVPLVSAVASDPELPAGASPSDYIVTLVDYGSAADAGTSTDGLDGRVQAFKRPIISQDKLTGHYAYWVGDESLKANFSIREPDATANAPLGSNEYNNRLQVPQRIGWENMEGFPNLSSTSLSGPNDPQLVNVVSHAHVRMLDPLFADDPSTLANDSPLNVNFHSITSHSKSLLTDQALGGIKGDLTQFLERGSGLRDREIMLDSSLYVRDDPRFGAYGGNNGGFPSALSSLPANAANDGLPTWGQLRDWYTNIGGRTAGSINVTESTAPIMTYLALHAGVSYDGATQNIRWHWFPVIALWNPYDVNLSTETYHIDVGVSPYLSDVIMVDTSPDIKLLKKDTGPDWKFEEDPITSDLKLTYVDSDGNRQEANVTFDEADARLHMADPSVSVEIVPATGVDNYNFNDGPWAKNEDPDLFDGYSDHYGRYYFHLEALPSDAFTEYANTNRSGQKGPLGDTAIPHKFFFHEGGDDIDDLALPVDKPLRLSISDNLSAGEVKIYSIGRTQEYLINNANPPRVALSSGLDNQPDSLWFNLFDVDSGPSTLSGTHVDDVKFHMELLAHSVMNPTVEIRTAAGDTLFHSPEGLGRVQYDHVSRNMRGTDLERYTTGTQKTGDLDNDRLPNQNEPPTQFISHMRLLPRSSSYTRNLIANDMDKPDSGMWGMGKIWLEPFTSTGVGINEVDNYPAFSRFNLSAKSFAENPLVEPVRNQFGFNTFNGTDFQGLSRMFSMQTEHSGHNDYYSNLASGSNAYAVVVHVDNHNDYQGISYLPIRNARRLATDVLSLGQLQQANLSTYLWMPSFPLGNSDASPYVDRGAIAGLHTYPMSFPYDPYNASRTNYPNAGFISNNARGQARTPFNAISEGGLNVEYGGSEPLRLFVGGNSMFDLSYALNENIWDRYFLSGITTSPSFTSPLKNSRLRFNEDAENHSAEAYSFDLAAAHLTNHGALNVNSTSVEAWRALLTAFRDLKLQGGGDGRTNNADTVPITRTLSPVGNRIRYWFDDSITRTVGRWTRATNKDYTDLMNGFRYLTDEMVEALAQRIVDEVRLRGPFYSMSDFVNRRLVQPEGANVPGSDWYEARTTVETPNRNGSGLLIAGNNDYIAPSYDPFIGLQGINGALQRAINL